MASVASKTWTDEEVGLLLDVFAEETIQIGLEKAKCPKDKNTVYLEVQKKLKQHGKFYMLKSFLLTVFIVHFHSALMLLRFSGCFTKE